VNKVLKNKFSKIKRAISKLLLELKEKTSKPNIGKDRTKIATADNLCKIDETPGKGKAILNKFKYLGAFISKTCIILHNLYNQRLDILFLLANCFFVSLFFLFPKGLVLFLKTNLIGIPSKFIFFLKKFSKYF